MTNGADFVNTFCYLWAELNKTLCYYLRTIVESGGNAVADIHIIIANGFEVN